MMEWQKVLERMQAGGQLSRMTVESGGQLAHFGCNWALRLDGDTQLVANSVVRALERRGMAKIVGDEVRLRGRWRHTGTVVGERTTDEASG